MKGLSFKAILKAIVQTLISIVRGDTLLRMRVDKLFPYILYAFILGWISIWMSLKAESAMHKLETNKALIEELKIEYVCKKCELIRLTRISTVEEKLKKAESEIQAPEKPAFTIER